MAYTITIYNSTKRINSTALPSGGYEESVVLKDGCSVLNPVFVLNTSVVNGNMIKWQNRYYWITDINFTRNNLAQITCEVDVLASWRDNIMSTTAFVNYSTSNFDVMLTDNRLPISSDSGQVSSSVNIGNLFNTDGSYVVGVIGNTPSPNTGGFVNVYQLTEAECANLGVFFSSEVEAITEITQKFGNAFGCLVFSKWIPVSPQGFGLYQVSIGGQQTDVFGELIKDRLRFGTVFVPIPWYSDDFRKFEPYSHASLYLPFVGVVQLSLQDLAEIVTLTVNWAFDFYTGEIVYTIINADGILALYKGNASTDIPLSTYQADISSKGAQIQNVAEIGVASGAATGIWAQQIAKLGSQFEGIGAGLKNFMSAVQSLTPMKPGILGGFSGAAGARLSLDLKLSIDTHPTSQAPSNMSDVSGRPCGKTLTMSSLSGYVECADFSVGGLATSYEKQKIEQYMKGGVFLE